MDFIGAFLRHFLSFKGRGRLLYAWLQSRRKGDLRTTRLSNGSTIEVDVGIPYEAMVWLGQEENEDLEALEALLQPGHSFVDVGANIGLWTLTAAMRVGPTGRVIAFEPNPVTADKLRTNVRSNRLRNTVVREQAVGRAKGKARFDCRESHNVSGLLQSGIRGTGMEIEVDVVSLDSLVSEYPQIHGMKIDVEGFEMPVLLGMEPLLDRDHPWICLEFNTTILGIPKLEQWDCYRFLQNQGYSSYTMQRAQKAFHADTPVEGYINVLFLHQSIGN